MRRTITNPPEFRTPRPTLDQLREGFNGGEIEIIRHAYRAAGSRYGESEVGMWAWLLSRQRNGSLDG